VSDFDITELNGTYTINQIAVTAAITVGPKVYDGGTLASITGCSLSGVLPADAGNVSCTFGSATANFANKNVGAGIAVSATGLTLAGSQAGNYSFTGNGSGTGNITPRGLTA